MEILTDQKRLIDGVAQMLEAAHGTVSQFETHISRVLVAGGYAFKFKKALRLPFLDFSALEARRFYCLEECRMNRRLAPHIYIDVVPVTGDPGHPVIGGAGEAIEYAVRMHAFEQQALWSFRLSHALLAAGDIDDLAPKLARFHRDAAIAPADMEWGTAQTIAWTSAETLSDLSELVAKEDGRDHLAALRRWVTAQQIKLADTFEDRKARNMVRECHGDLHCGNVLTENDEVQVFDCIEFNDRLRWIDVMNDIAFLHMDLSFGQRTDLAAQLLNRYLEITGDYQGVKVLPYYRTHRALVRAKVMLLRAHQPGILAEDAIACTRSGLAYLAFARKCSQPKPAAIMIMHGYSGSGKTTFARYLVPLLDAIQVRSDVERKRMHDIPEADRSGASSGAPLYSVAATQRTYARLRSLARDIVNAGWSVIIDAACLKASQRALFHALAVEAAVPFFIFDVRVSGATMRNRIVSREKTGLDASDAGVGILERQIRNDEPLTAEEAAHVIVIDMESGTDLGRVKEACAPVLAALGGR